MRLFIHILPSNALFLALCACAIPQNAMKISIDQTDAIERLETSIGRNVCITGPLMFVGMETVFDLPDRADSYSSADGYVFTDIDRVTAIETGLFDRESIEICGLLHREKTRSDCPYLGCKNYSLRESSVSRLDE